MTEKQQEIITLNSDNISPAEEGATLFESRSNYFKSLRKPEDPLLSMIIVGYNRLEKTKECVRCALEQIQDIDCELILVDNGSTDETFSFFNSVSFPEKKIIRVTKNIGAGFGGNYANSIARGEFIMHLANDVYLTPNSVKNLLTCIQSDERIGVVNALSDNVSNLQQPHDFTYSTWNDFQEQAKRWNQSDPQKWQERLRLISLGSIYRKYVWDLIGSGDPAFFHDFAEDDLCIRIRRAGYKLFLCCDTVIKHDHDIFGGEGKDLVKYGQTLQLGREIYRKKYYGLDAWDDVLNFSFDLQRSLIGKKQRNSYPSILGVDVKMGTPILDIVNHLRTQNIFQTERWAFTTDAKYYLDLQTICDGNVACDLTEYLRDYFSLDYFDYIIVGERLNRYKDPLKLLQDLILLLKEDGSLMFYLKNSYDFKTLLTSLGQSEHADDVLTKALSLDDLVNHLKKYHLKHIDITTYLHPIDQKSVEFLKEIVKNTKLVKNIEETVERLCIQDYGLCVKK